MGNYAGGDERHVTEADEGGAAGGGYGGDARAQAGGEAGLPIGGGGELDGPAGRGRP